jgi:hypothetical protein
MGFDAFGAAFFSPENMGIIYVKHTPKYLQASKEITFYTGRPHFSS